eukprot:7832519-Pyramimonas_sp.AAC.2
MLCAACLNELLLFDVRACARMRCPTTLRRWPPFWRDSAPRSLILLPLTPPPPHPSSPSPSVTVSHHQSSSASSLVSSLPLSPSSSSPASSLLSSSTTPSRFVAPQGAPPKVQVTAPARRPHVHFGTPLTRSCARTPPPHPFRHPLRLVVAS